MIQEKMMKKQVKSLTSLRGIAAISVVFHHYTQYLLPEISPVWLNYTHYFSNGYLWVDFFFMLSGVVLAHVYGQQFIAGFNSSNYKKFVIARFARIYPLHLLTLLVFFGFELFSYLISNKSNLLINHFSGSTSLSALVENIFLLQGTQSTTTWNQPSWSIGAEWFVYLLFPLLCYVLKIQKTIVLFISYCCLLVTLFLLISTTVGHLDLSGWPAILRAFLEFTVGLLLYKVYVSTELSYYFKDQSLMLVAIVAVVLTMHFDWHDILVIPAFSLLILTAALSTGNVVDLLNSQKMEYLGNISFTIYMIHWPLYIVVSRLWLKFTKQTFGEGLSIIEATGVLLICITMVLLISGVIYRKFEIPIRHYINTYFKTHV